MAAVLHGVLLGPVSPTYEQRAAIAVPTVVIGHGADFIHPFSDAAGLVRLVQHGRLLRAQSMIELRVHPARLTAEIAEFLDAAWGQPAASQMSA